MMAYIAAKRKHAINHVLRGEDNAPSTNDHRTFIGRTWNNFLSGLYLPSMWPANNPLSVTIVNNEILNSDLSEHLTSKNKELSYILQEEKFLCDLKQKNPEDYTYNEYISVSLEHASKNHLQDWSCNNVDDSNLIKNRNYVNLIKNFGDTYKDNSTMESHSMLRVNETEKITEDIMTDVSGPGDIDPQKREIGIHEDTDVESFLVVSHSDVPATPADFIKENPMSRLSNICRNAWDNFTSRLYCKTKSADSGMSVKYLSYSTKQHHRRKANAIAIGRGRGRAKGQLRRSGVSQTVCRKEGIKYDDYEVLSNDFIDTAPNDCPLDNKRDNLNKDIPDTTRLIKQINSPIISSSPKTTSAKRKPKARKKKIKTKYMTKVRYTVDSSKMNDYYEDSNSEMLDLSRSQLLSKICSKDGFVGFKDDELPETCEKQGTTEHLTEACNVPDSSMSTNDSPYDDSDSEIYDVQKDSFRLRSSSEGSDDSTDGFMISDRQKATEYSKIRYDCLTKIDDKRCEDCNSQTQKNSFQRHRLLSDSSQNTDDGFIVFADIEENCAIDDVDGDEMSSFDSDSRLEIESISEDDQDSEELIAQTKKVIKDL